MGPGAPGNAPGVPLRILLVVDGLEGGGAERHVADLAGALRARGWAAHVACSAGGRLETQLRDAGVPVHVLGGDLVKRRTSRTYASALQQLVTGLAPDLVHAHVHASEVAAASALIGSSVPLVLTEHTEAPWRCAAESGSARRALSRADLVVAVSSAIARRLVEELGVPADRVRLVLPAAPARSSARDRSGWGPASSVDRPAAGPVVGRAEGPVVGYVGRLAPEKGLPVLLDAFPQLRRAVWDARLQVVGDGPERARLAAAAAPLGSAVQLLGFRDDVPALLRGMQVLAVPSLSDGSPLVVAEANAAGVPVVASTAGGLPDRVVPGVDGLLVPPRDTPALAAALMAVLTDEPLRLRLARAGRQRAARETHAAMVDRLEELYRGLVPEVASTASQNLWRTGVV